MVQCYTIILLLGFLYLKLIKKTTTENISITASLNLFFKDEKAAISHLSA